MAALLVFDNWGVAHGMIPVTDLRAAVLRVERVDGAYKRCLRLTVYGAVMSGDGKLIIGGRPRLLARKNAGLGKRRCPFCIAGGKESWLYSRGPLRDTCRTCGKRSDHITTAFEPYFRYYRADAQAPEAEHIYAGSRDQILADELKTALKTNRPETLRLPVAVELRGVYHAQCYSVMEPLVFNTQISKLTGRYLSTRYDFR